RDRSWSRIRMLWSSRSRYRVERELHRVRGAAGAANGHRSLALDRPDDPRLVDPDRHRQGPQHARPLLLRLAAQFEVSAAGHVGQHTRSRARLEPQSLLTQLEDRIHAVARTDLHVELTGHR